MDVNDASYSLERVIPQRKAEDAWQVDSFEGASAAPTRPPVEVRSFSGLPCSVLTGVVRTGHRALPRSYSINE